MHQQRYEVAAKPCIIHCASCMHAISLPHSTDVHHVPKQVVDAMRTTISNMVGVLPPQLFDVTVSTVGENLAQLMFSLLMTGERTQPLLGPIC